jgi:hypothetical protein
LRARARAFGGVDDVRKRPREEHLPYAGVPCCRTRHLVQHRKAAVNLAARRPVVLDRAGEILIEARIQKVVIVAHLKAHVGKRVGKIPAQIVADLL